MTYLGVCCARGFTQSDSKNEHSSYHYLTFTFLNGAAYCHFGQDKMFEMFHSRSGKIETMSTRIRWVDSKTECYDILIPSMPAGITKKWHAFYDIFCMPLYYTYEYSNEEMLWIWRVSGPQYDNYDKFAVRTWKHCEELFDYDDPHWEYYYNFFCRF